MLEVININPIQKGSLLATCDVHIIPWKITFCEIKIFEKGASRWINLPSKEVISDSGEKRYVELITFDNDGIKNRFRSQIMGAIDKFLAENPEMKVPDPIQVDDDVPF